jgi:[protein-PII] uridylyltransferase
MHKSGVLFRLFPEFRKIYFKVQYDIYHVYPVDLHSLLVLHELDKLRKGEYVKDQPLLSFLIKEVKDISLLYFAALFHDIGKGYGSGHAKRGALIVERVMKRMKTTPEEIMRASFLIMNHLKMSEISQRRDLSDLKHIFDFAEIVRDRENLKYLYILTFADLKAVSPNALTHWKSALLQELYIKTEEILEKGRISEHVLKERIVEIQQKIRDELSTKYSKEEVEAFIDVFPVRDFLTNSVEDIVKYFEILKDLEHKKYFISKVDYPEKRYSKVIFAAADSPGIFSKIAGTLSSNGINILSAQINTMRNGRILDVFYVNDVIGEAVSDPLRWDNTLNDLDDVINGRVEIDKLISQRLKPSILKVKKRRELPTRIVIDNHSSDLYTLIEVYTQDRPGVLYRIASTISSLALNIYRAKISTKVDQVADVFYVSNLKGGKILERSEIKKVKEKLFNALSYNYEK